MSTLAREGVWTPWAEVLCVECDHHKLLRGENQHRAAIYPKHVEALGRMDRTALVEQPEGEALAKCDACRCDCWVRVDVALCQAVIRQVQFIDDAAPYDGALDQTGGMCCAAVFRFPDKSREIVVTAMDGELVVGEYRRADEPPDEGIDWQEPVGGYWSSAPIYADGDELVAKDVLRDMIEECAGQVVNRALGGSQHE